MSEAADEAKLAVIIGITIVLVWKAIDLFSQIFIKYLTQIWKDSPQFATDILGFAMMAIIFTVIVLVYIARRRGE